MIINELICKPDGTQKIVQREVSDDFFTPSIQTPDPQADTDAMLVDLEYRLTLLEMGVN